MDDDFESRLRTIDSLIGRLNTEIALLHKARFADLQYVLITSHNKDGPSSVEQAVLQALLRDASDDTRETARVALNQAYAALPESGPSEESGQQIRLTFLHTARKLLPGFEPE